MGTALKCFLLLTALWINQDFVDCDDRIGSESSHATSSDFEDFRMIDEIILELEKNYPSNSYANIVADSGSEFSPVAGTFGPNSNFSVAGSSDSTLRVVGGMIGTHDPSIPLRGGSSGLSGTTIRVVGGTRGTTIPVVGGHSGSRGTTIRLVGGSNTFRGSNISVSGSHLPQSADANRYSDPSAVFDVDMHGSKVVNGSVLQYLSEDDEDSGDRDKRGALDLAQIIKCATGCDPLLFKGYGCFCGYLGSGTPVDGIDTCCKMHDWCYTTSTCMGLAYDLPYFVPFKWKCNGGSPYCIPGKSRKNDRNSCSHQLCECDREFAMCLKRYLPCPTSKAVCKAPQRMVQNVVMGVGSGQGYHRAHKPTYQAVPRKDAHRPAILPYLNFG